MSKFKEALLSLNASLKLAYEQSMKFIFNLGLYFGTLLAILLAVIPLSLLAVLLLSKSPHPSEYTVKITNLAGNSGGSGVIVSSSNEGSQILTNYHVCGVLLNDGGKVIKTNGEEHFAVGMIRDTEHDLCLVTVAANMGTPIKIAEESPLNYEEASITGHPHLIPNIITKGHFGGRAIISLVWRLDPCEPKDFANPEIGAQCFFMGGKPVIRNFESRVVSATIMPGSSGSAVLNKNGELSGLVFAGDSQGLSYAFTVPLDAIHRFLRRASLKEPTAPWVDLEPKQITTNVSPDALKDAGKKFKDYCKKNNNNKFCKNNNNNYVLGELL